ncbi:EfeM/EfeO family lipoprotein [Nocardia macrotermitis]|uniref:EfeM/EfeO family lipoprotein n=1 Tax=Nocardia macrotermitis TaxID=2585198 RepID=UPI001D10AE92|nr:EfeM/EfeO family lipoprotein [Nocardia macrotermitis]
MGTVRRIVVAVVVTSTAAVASACGHGGPATPTQQIIDVSANACGAGWTDPHTGQQTLYFRNTGSNPATVDLVDVHTGAIAAEVPDIGPNTTRDMRVDIGGGTFAFRCATAGSSNAMSTGPSVTLAGPAAASSIPPVTPEDLYGPDKQYVDYVAAGLTRLAADTDILRDTVAGGDLATARTAWLTAHLDYERLGAAYDAFGDYDGKLDGRTDGLPGGVADPDFTGFHRVEYGLWHGESLAALAGPTGQLATDVHGLVADFPNIQVPLLDLGLRTHEILENTLQFEMTGDADYGSGSSLATAVANIAGTRELLTVLDPVLRTRYQQLPRVTTWLNRFETQLETHHLGATAGNPASGAWTAVSALSRPDREQLNGTLSQLLEYLAPIATICKPRKTFQ